jgi:hypothetical protein
LALNYTDGKLFYKNNSNTIANAKLISNIVGTANEVTVSESSGTFTISLPDTISVTTVNTSSDTNIGGKLSVIASSGDEGGEIFLAKAATNTTLSGGITIDSYQNKIRFFEQGGTARGAYIDITACAGSAGTNLLSLTSVGTLTAGTWTANTIGVQYGGTGLTTITANGVLYGNGTGAIANTGAGTAGYVLTAGTGGIPTWTANTGTGNAVRATSPTISNLTITTTGSNTISTPANTVVGNRYLALTNSAFGYVIESITAGSGISVTASIDPTISINTSVVATLTGTQTLTNKTLTSPSMTTATVTSGGIDVTGVSEIRGTFSSSSGLLIGNDAANYIIAYNSGIQRYASAGAATGVLSLNPDGGSVVFGADLYNLTTSNYIQIGANQDTGIGANTTTDIGVRLSGSGAIWASRNDGTLLVLNRMRHTSGGTLAEFRTNGTARGDITIAGNTVSYNAFLGSHHTEIDGSTPLVGTVMESTGEMVEGLLYDQDRLPKCAISTTASSSAVFGVYLSEHHNDDGFTGHLVAAIGAAWIRISPEEDPVLGDLIESNGDGCARVQADDVIRSSTIGKISSTTRTQIYEDGSYLLPCVLYCG